MSILTSHVDQLFANAARQPWQSGKNAILGWYWLDDDAPMSKQKEHTHRALLACEWFVVYGPPDAPSLPLSVAEQDALRYHDPLGHLVAEFARSLEANDWDFRNHPGFDDFARGALASEYSPDFTRKNSALCKRYPPRRLRGLGPGQIWQNPPRHSRPSCSIAIDAAAIGVRSIVR